MKLSGQPEAAIFDELKSQAGKNWQGLQEAKAVVMVGAATCGRAAGALKVLRAIKDEIKKQKLDCPVFEVGCMGALLRRADSCHQQKRFSPYRLPAGKPGYRPPAG